MKDDIPLRVLPYFQRNRNCYFFRHTNSLNRKTQNAALQLRAHSTHIRTIVAARQLQALVGRRLGRRALLGIIVVYEYQPILRGFTM